jgi:hypothetical protein
LIVMAAVRPLVQRGRVRAPIDIHQVDFADQAHGHGR